MRRIAPREALFATLIPALPAAGIVLLAFDSGGFFPGTVAVGVVAAAAALAVRVALARRPFDGLGRSALAAMAALAAFGIWTLASAIWSDAPGRALVEADRVALYLLVLVFVASAPRHPGTAMQLAGWIAAAVVVVCGAAFISRTLPDLLRAPPNVNEDRLSYPLTYWNALGLLAAVGLVLSFHVAADARRRAAAALGAAATPLLAATLILTFSRGSILVASAALLGYVILGRPRGLVGALLACAPAAAVAIYASLGAELLAEPGYASDAGREQGRDLALTVALACAGAAIARPALFRVDAAAGRLMRRRGNRRLAVGVMAAAGIAAAGIGIAGGVQLLDRSDDTQAGEPVQEADGPTRDRLLDASGNGRSLLWAAARDTYRDHKALGTGAGTYELQWHQHREPPTNFDAVDAHSLYLEVLSELGLAGVILLLAALGIPLAALAMRVRGPERPAWAALLAAVLAWAVHAATDWDWEMPAVTLFVFAAFGAAVARSAPAAAGAPTQASRPALTLAARAPAVVACGLLAFVPWQLARSDRHVNRSVRAVLAGDCARGAAEARAARDALAVRPQPFELLGICLAGAGRYNRAMQTLETAVERDPRNWEVHYELALVKALAGEDPREVMAVASRLNPHELLVYTAAREFATDRPAVWRDRARALPFPGLDTSVDGGKLAPAAASGGDGAAGGGTPIPDEGRRGP